MASFKIKGGNKLHGEITPQGAKNEALQILSAVLLTSEKVHISNIPNIIDVNKLIDILSDLGVKVEKLQKGSYSFQADQINLDHLSSNAFKDKGGRLRGSIMIVGPLLARFGKAAIPRPGGDKIGRRRLDTHFIGFQKLGAEFNYDDKNGFFEIKAKELRGAFILLEEASVTGTANIVMAASLAKGKTTIYNAACEPYIQQLCKMINNMGGKISGIGSNLLVIEGVERLGGCIHRVLPDMIEIGSWIGLAAMTQSELIIKDVAYDELGVIPNTFRKLGIKIERKEDDILVPSQDYYQVESFIDGSIMNISDAPWPGFTPDLLSIILVDGYPQTNDILHIFKITSLEGNLKFINGILGNYVKENVHGTDKKVK